MTNWQCCLFLILNVKIAWKIIFMIVYHTDLKMYTFDFYFLESWYSILFVQHTSKNKFIL